eukprot:2219637-Pyramimonas_sp.AAC.1
MPEGLELDEEDRLRIEERTTQLRELLTTKANDLFSSALDEAKRVVQEHESQKTRLLAKRRRVQDVEDKEPQSKPGGAEGSQPETASAA